jgi:CO/xanthine dehydrogenase FAD-binding subunit
MEFHQLVLAQTIEEAYEAVKDRGATILGGATWLRITAKHLDYAVDISDLGLSYIRETGDRIEIGATTTLRSLETDSLLASRYGGLFARTLGHIVGVQLRNLSTIGGSLAGRYGFSDVATLFLALEAQLDIYPSGLMNLEDYMAAADHGPHLIRSVSIPAHPVPAAFQTIRITHSDFPILNAAAAYTNKGWRIAVGARPGRAQLAKSAMQALGTEAKPGADLIARAARLSAEELGFGKDIRADEEYRKTVCPVLVRRAVEEASR